ncbi:acetyltransferase [Peribacillus simplex]|uniref:acetyltransferase n=1 Tax=Peribacillus simplex TaxID=1478 RepID=UPI00203ECA83|nr:acetyltransferase [Peribacillus simplex]MCM3673364.1 acetyltransferase [Peribacillus simplex]
MANLLILGAGGHGKVVSEIAILKKFWENIAFLDDRENINEVLNISVIGKFDEYNSFKNKYQYAFVAIGDNKLRLKWMERLSREGFIMPTLVHPFSSISKTSILGEGTVVMAGAVINSDTRVGRGCIINTSASIDHDCSLQDGVHISPGVNIGGTVSIDKCTWACIGSSVINNINVGSNVVLAAGAVVNKNIPDNVMVAGVPAKIKKQFGVFENE